MIGFVQECKAEGAFRALMQLVVPVARVIRDGQDQEVDSRELVVGDVVLLESGVRVPADLRLTSTSALSAHFLSARFGFLIDEGRSAVIVAASDVSFMDSTRLHALVEGKPMLQFV